MARNTRQRNNNTNKASSTNNGNNGTTTSQQQQQVQSAFQTALQYHQKVKAKMDSTNNSSTSFLRMIRIILVAIVCGNFLTKNIRQYVLPYGPAVDRNATTHASYNDVLLHTTTDSSCSSNSSNNSSSTSTSIYTNNHKIQKILLPPQPSTTIIDYNYGPETIVFNPNDDSMYILTEDAYLVRVDPIIDDDTTTTSNNNNNTSIILNSTTTMIADLGIGRPLGSQFTYNNKNKNNKKENTNTLYICDAVLGLTRIQNIVNVDSTTTSNNNKNNNKNKNNNNKKQLIPKVEIVSRSTVMFPNGTKASPIRFANDLVIGPKTGFIYFTDSTDISPMKKQHMSSSTSDSSNNDILYDPLHTSKVDLLRGKPMGRLLQYNPMTDETIVLQSNLYFSNGLAIDEDETYIIMVETFGVTLYKYYIQNSTIDVLLNSTQIYGYLDGVDCSWETQYCYTVMPSAIVPLHHIINSLPNLLSQVIRTIILLLPKFLYPKVQPFGGIIEIHPITKEYRYILFDPTIIHTITGVTIYQNKLYLGSLSNNYIGIYHL